MEKYIFQFCLQMSELGTFLSRKITLCNPVSGPAILQAPKRNVENILDKNAVPSKNDKFGNYMQICRKMTIYNSEKQPAADDPKTRNSCFSSISLSLAISRSQENRCHCCAGNSKFQISYRILFEKKFLHVIFSQNVSVFGDEFVKFIFFI